MTLYNYEQRNQSIRSQFVYLIFGFTLYNENKTQTSDVRETIIGARI